MVDEKLEKVLQVVGTSHKNGLQLNGELGLPRIQVQKVNATRKKLLNISFFPLNNNVFSNPYINFFRCINCFKSKISTSSSQSFTEVKSTTICVPLAYIHFYMQFTWSYAAKISHQQPGSKQAI